ncbi:D-aspartate oxidase-like isoform X1 [Mya arenaria]|uniref:D-aspartate oxidase-like isoform X1 n=1 Tax=Mya arenaria TaxID=6604 RepID=UPI0022E912B9|nr:D-aspartate oxidase-like isoform X1 [Mya arenaria]
MSRRRVCVVGAGVIGLSSALRVLDVCPDAEVTVVAAKFSPETTTDVSGGFWEPHLLGDTPEADVRRWSSKTFEHIVRIADSSSARETGACYVSGYQLNENPGTQAPFWKDDVLNFRLLTAQEVKAFPGMGMGFFYTTVMLEPCLYLEWLLKRYQSRGGKIQKKHLQRLSDLSVEGYDVIVNCTGIGARDLVGDTSLTPYRGQVIRVSAPWLKTHYSFCLKNGTECYMLPGMNYVVMGGTEAAGDWNTAPRESDRQIIWDACTKYVPNMKAAKVLGDHVGLRPGRPSVRLEVETLNVGGKQIPVVHNYGHGGGGVTLHWGCAEQAASLVRQALPVSVSQPTSKL